MGSVGSNNSFRNALNAIETDIYDDKEESLYVLDANGESVLAKKGGVDRVSYAEEIAENPDLFKGKVATHNHPSNSTFNYQDIYTIAQHGLKEIRAVGSGGSLFSLKRIGNEQNVDIWKDFKTANESYCKNELDPIWEEAERKYNAGLITEAESDAIAEELNKKSNDQRRQWLKDNAKSYGYKYSESKRRVK